MEEANGPYLLPRGWAWRPLPQVADVIMGQSPPGSTYNSDQIGLPFFQGKADFGELHPTARVWCDKPRKVAEPGDVLIAVRAPVGPTNIATERCAIRRGLAAIRPKDGLPSRLLREYFVHIERQVADKGTGSTFSAIGKEVLESLVFPLPPLPEQQRLVEKIKRLLEQNRTAREALDRVLPLLKRVRAVVLAKAFRGELTERDPNDEPASVLLERIREERRRKWEEDLQAKGKYPRRAKYVEPEPPDANDLPELPEGWMWTTVGEVIRLLQYGSSVKASSSKGTGIPIIGMGNLRNGEIKLHDPKYVDESDEDIARYLLEPDDILINRTNSPELVGKAARWNIEGRFIFASYLIRLRADARVVAPQYLAHLMSSQTTRDHIARVRHQVAGQSNINSRDIRSIPVPLAPMSEQHQIVDRISILFSHSSAIEERVQIARLQAARLDQAMLARAFRGEI